LEIADCPHSTPRWTDSGVLVLRSRNIRNGRLDLSVKSYTDEAHFEQRSRRARLRGGDLVITREAPMGEVCLIPEGLRCCLGQRMVMLRPDPKKCNSRFLLYSIQSRAVQDEIKVNEGTGSTVSNLRIPLLEALPILCPPLAEQKAIAAVLGALDDKIELNRRMNATLETMVRALFRSWLVDFDPVRAKLEGRIPAALDPATAALFPEHLEDSPVGHIPKGWKACPLAELIEVVKGRSYRSEELAESKTALVTLKSFLRGGGYRSDGLKPFRGEYKPNQRVRAGDLVVAFTDVTQAADVIGKPALVRSDDRFDTLVASLDVGIVRPKSKHVSIPFLYCLFLTAEFQAHAYSHATGTTVLHLGATAIPSFVAVVPPVEIAEKFVERADPILRLIDENAKQSCNLATLRDTLLPKLLSGGIQPTRDLCQEL
jgi:type I restriction enzyme S subunit